MSINSITSEVELCNKFRFYGNYRGYLFQAMKTNDTGISVVKFPDKKLRSRLSFRGYVAILCQENACGIRLKW